MSAQAIVSGPALRQIMEQARRISRRDSRRLGIRLSQNGGGDPILEIALGPGKGGAPFWLIRTLPVEGATEWQVSDWITLRKSDLLRVLNGHHQYRFSAKVANDNLCEVFLFGGSAYIAFLKGKPGNVVPELGEAILKAELDAQLGYDVTAMLSAERGWSLYFTFRDGYLFFRGHLVGMRIDRDCLRFRERRDFEGWIDLPEQRLIREPVRSITFHSERFCVIESDSERLILKY